jgi:hypothetical protein
VSFAGLPSGQVPVSAWAAGYAWLLTLDVGGTRYRLADRALNVSDTDGTLHYAGRLTSVDFERDAPTMGMDSDVSVDVGFVSPVSLAGLFLAGAPLHLARAELAVLPPGQTFARRVVLARGRVSWGDLVLADVPTRLTIEQALGVDRGTMLDPRQAISRSTWASSPDGSSASGKSTQGQLYPLLFGSPGYDYVDGTERAGFPIFPVLEDLGTPRHIFLVAAGATQGAVAEIFCAEQTLRNAAPLTTSTDALGQTVTIYDTGMAGTAVGASAAQAEEAFACLGLDGGTVGPYRAAGPLTAATDVLRLAAERSTLDWDEGSIVGAGEVLDLYRLDGYLDAQVAPLDFVRAELLPILPIALVPGPRGISIVLTNRAPRADEAVAHLEQGRNAWADSLSLTPETEADDIVGAVAISYDYRPRDGSFSKQQTLTANASEAAAAAAASASLASFLAQGPAGQPPGRVDVETAFVGRAEVAGLIAQDIFAARSTPRASRTYRVGPDLAGIAPGQAVLLTDADLGLTRQPVRVLRWAPLPGGVGLTLELRPRVRGG